MSLVPPIGLKQERRANVAREEGERGCIDAHLRAERISRRRFLEFCAALMVTAPRGLALTGQASPEGMAETIGAAQRPSVIWLHFQDCTGCTESVLHASQPDIVDLIFNLISLDYHETLMAGSGRQAESVLKRAVARNAGRFILVVEGSVPTGDRAGYMKIAGRTALEVLREVASQAALVIAIGSCSSWGGVAAAHPNPSRAEGIDSIVSGMPIVNLPGCPPNPYTFLAVVLEYATMHRLPQLDSEKRPRFAYDRLIHEDCPRRGHFDAGRFAGMYGDEGHRQGWCLYKLGCKGPLTHAACSIRHFNDLPNAWPIGIGAPCIGCAERNTGFSIPLFQTVDIHAATPPERLAQVTLPSTKSQTAAALAIGALAGIGGMGILGAVRRLPSKDEPAIDKEGEDSNRNVMAPPREDNDEDEPCR